MNTGKNMKPGAAIKTLFAIYNACWACAIPFLKGNSRISDGFEQRSLKDSSMPEADIWIQSASAGEAYLSLEILNRLVPGEKTSVLLTANTRQGLDILEKSAAEINGNTGDLLVHARFSPFDSPSLMGKAVARVNPKLMVLVELEIWPGLLRALKTNGTPVIIVNGRLTERSLKRYLLFPGLWKYLAPEKVLAMSQGDAERFRALFPETPVSTVSNIKFDRLPKLVQKEEPLAANPLSFLADPEKPVVVLGSVREEEEEMAGRIIAEITLRLPNARIFLFPRHMHRLDSWRARLLFMNADFGMRSGDRPEKHRIVLWDVFGELGHAYKLAQTAFVGGSLAPLGGQNFLEPLSCGVIPVIGPSWENFAWVGQGMVENGLLEIGETWKDVAEKLILHASNPMDRQKVKALAAGYIDPLRGGTDATCREIERLFTRPAHPA
jgi:3-deoxy-D-manno-octulosonic-acid transferase